MKEPSPSGVNNSYTSLPNECVREVCCHVTGEGGMPSAPTPSGDCFFKEHAEEGE